MDLKKIMDNITNFEEFKISKSAFFSKNNSIKKLKQQLKNAERSEKATIGKLINEKLELGRKAFDVKWIELQKEEIQKKVKNEWLDITKLVDSDGGLHPLTKIINLFKEWFSINNYVEKAYSDIETDEYNFQKLNIAKNHPARDMHDSLYINENLLLRTHNTGATIRTLIDHAPNPVAAYTIGNVYRNDDDDETHSHQFIQCDLAVLGQVSIQNLIWTLKSLLSHVLEEELEIRMRPSFFPFTEPSMEVDILYKKKWIEVLGSGMLHPNVLKMSNYDPEKIRGFAAGIGIERIAMIKYNLKHIKEFYRNDLRFNKQFKGVF